jgi:hypothetical protein
MQADAILVPTGHQGIVCRYVMTDMTGGKGLIDKQVGSSFQPKHRMYHVISGALPANVTVHVVCVPSQTSVAGMIGMLEDGLAGKRELQGSWHDYSGGCWLMVLLRVQCLAPSGQPLCASM